MSIDKKLNTAYFNDASYINNGPDIGTVESSPTRAPSQATPLNVPIFYLSLIFKEHCNGKKVLVLTGFYIAEMGSSFAFHHALTACGSYQAEWTGVRAKRIAELHPVDNSTVLYGKVEIVRSAVHPKGSRLPFFFRHCN